MPDNQDKGRRFRKARWAWGVCGGLLSLSAALAVGNSDRFSGDAWSRFPYADNHALGPLIANRAPVYSSRFGEPAVSASSADEAGESAGWTKFLPWTQSSDNHSAPVRVWAGGQAIGVRIQSNRVTVVGYERAAGVSPAAAARIQPGDVIEKIGSHPVSTIRDVRRWVNLSPVPLTLTIRHGQLRRIVTLRPLVESDGTRRLGLYVRDTTSGIGTLTFYDPVHHRFGALGHVITDVETGMPVEGTGVLYDAEVTGVVRGQPGRPGEKRGRMDVQRGQLGDVWRNTEFGVFGRIHRNPHSALFKGPLVVASPAQVHVGPAKMLTVLHGRRVDAFDVVIESVAHQDTPSPKSLVIRVTDPRLLAETGGIVQGMSGSPVIQDGRLAAAVTHVFISDVTRGYGVYAAWMMQQAQASPGAGVGKRKAVRAAWARQATAARSATGS